MIIGGPIWGSIISKSIHVELPQHEQIDDNQRVGKGTPSFGLALGLIALPLIMISLNTIGSRFVEKDSDLYNWLAFIGHPFTAILVACLMAFYLLGARRGVPNARIMEICGSALQPAGIIILVTGAGGVFKQVLVDSGVGTALGNYLAGSGLPIVILAFVLSAAVRVIQGSATVAMLTACGLIIPMLQPLGLDGAQLAAVTIAIGGGSIVLSHVNDSGFWLASRYLGLSEMQTLKTWTVMETIIGTVGALVAMIISLFL